MSCFPLSPAVRPDRRSFQTRFVTPDRIVGMLVRYALPPRSVDVDTPEKPKRPWWQKKRWWSAILLWIVLAYPLSLWPVAYLVGRGWLPVFAVKGAYAPVTAAAAALRPHPGIGLGPPGEDGRRPYIVLPDPDPSPRVVEATAEGYIAAAEWFANLGQQHAASD